MRNKKHTHFRGVKRGVGNVATLSGKIKRGQLKQPGNVRLALERFSDSSSSRTAGIFTCTVLGEVVCAEELSDMDLYHHINEQEIVY